MICQKQIQLLKAEQNFFCFSSLIFHTIIKQKKGDRKNGRKEKQSNRYYSFKSC